MPRWAKWRSSVGVCIISAVAGGCSSPKPGEAAKSTPVIKIDRLEPSSTGITRPFNVRADGQAALAVFGAGLSSDDAVFWNDQRLETSGSGDFVAAVVPSSLYQTPGVVSVTVRSATGSRSNALEFRIYDKTGPEPRLAQLYPNAAVIGKGFNIMPDGKSAVGVSGENFLPGVTLVADGQKLKTVFGNGTGISAVVPDTLIASAGQHRIWAINPDGKASNKVTFLVTNK